MNTNQTLVKIKSSYDKLEKAMNEPAKDYNAIKELVETKENSIMNIKSIKNKDLQKIKIWLLYHHKRKIQNNIFENEIYKLWTILLLKVPMLWSIH